MVLQWLASRLSPATKDETTQIIEKQEEASPVREEQNSLVANLVAIACLLIFVAAGVAQAISIRFSVGRSGHMAYDASAAVAAAEGAKLVFSLGWVACFDRESMPRPTAVPSQWYSEAFILFLIAVGFAIQNQVAFLAVERLGPSFYAILGNLKIVFTCVFMRLILRRTFSILQWIAVIMLTTSAVFVKVPFLLQGGAGVEHEEQSRLTSGVLMMLLATSSSGLSAVYNELVLKRQTEGADMPFMAKNLVLYTWGFGINYFVWYSTGSLPFLAWYYGNGCFAIICMTFMGLSCAVVLRYLDNIYRCFAACTQVLMIVFIAHLILPPELQEEPFSIFHACALLLLAQAIVIYSHHESKELGWYLGVATIFTIMISLACRLIDKSRVLDTAASMLGVSGVREVGHHGVPW